MTDADIIIVGAGVVGLFTALEAAHKGLTPLVLEERSPGAGASTRNAGVLHLIQPPPGKLRRRLALEGARLYRVLAGGIGYQVYETRLLILATTRLESLLLRPALIAIRRLAPGVKARIAGRREILRLEPEANPKVRSGIIVEGYGVVEPRHLISRLAREAEARGGIETGKKVTGIKCRGDKVIVEASDGSEYTARYAINAAGAGAEVLARQHGIRVRVELKPGTMEIYQDPKPRNILARIPTTSKTKGGAVIPWPQGTLYGPDLRESPGDPQPSPGAVAAKYRRLIRRDPRGLLERIEGLRTVAKPRDFHLIVPERCPRVVHLLGIESPGLTAAPALARLALSKLFG
ncbi:MAG: FAD-binding oxidoreductase [Desulfurococcales archaeon]|nr:FAD-binding oxidoreductase [Desulfurococcales archaeon]